MTPERFAAIIARHGEAMILKRNGQADLAIRGKRYGGLGAGVTGQIQATGFNIKIANAEILAASCWGRRWLATVWSLVDARSASSRRSP